MRKAFYLVFTILFPSALFSQTIDKDSTTDQILKSLCDGYKFFQKCEIPVDFKYGKKAVEDSMTNYLKANNSQFQNGKKATFLFVVAKDANLYNIEMKSGNISSDSSIIKAMQQTGGLWEVGKQNSYPICSYVRLEVEFIDDRVTVSMVRPKY